MKQQCYKRKYGWKTGVIFIIVWLFIVGPATAIEYKFCKDNCCVEIVNEDDTVGYYWEYFDGYYSCYSGAGVESRISLGKIKGLRTKGVFVFQDIDVVALINMNGLAFYSKSFVFEWE